MTTDPDPVMKTTFCALACVSLPLLSALSPAGRAAEPPAMSPEFAAVLRAGDAGKLKDALDHGAPVTARDAAGNTPLILAAGSGDAACLRLLLDRGADVNAVNADGAGALMRAATDFEKTALLVKRGANVPAQSALGNTALMLAARPWNSHRTVEWLLDHGADARATNHWGASALMAAAAGGDAASVRALLRHGADVNAQPAIGPGPAFIFGGGRSALMWAAYRGDVAILKILIEAGADVNAEGLLGTPLAQAAWADQADAARFLLDRGARVNQASHGDGYTALHWAASTEERDVTLVKLLLDRGADANAGGGENVDAFMGTLQTPLMLARRRGETPILSALVAAGATNGTPDRVPAIAAPERRLPQRLTGAVVQEAIRQALPPLQQSALDSKQAFVRHASHQDCVSCHQQYLPLAAVGLARRQQHVPVDTAAERALIEMVQAGELKNLELDWQALFHPEPVHTKGYALFGLAAEGIPGDERTDAWVHHLAALQGRDGRWFNNLPRPPIQTGDIGATALAIHALQHYPMPGHKAGLAAQVDRARSWLHSAKPDNNESRIYQLLGLAWAGEPARKLEPLTRALLAQQRPDGGWAQLPGTASDAYATGQALYALRVGAGLTDSDPAVDKGRRYLLQTQLADGTWHVRRRTFPFQPTMDSGFPHGRDSWISAAATSWAVLALSLSDEIQTAALRP